MKIWEKYQQDFKDNLRLALPIMGGQLGQIMVNLADNLMVGRLGSVALASVSLANAIFIVFFVLGMGISFALPPLVAQADGSEDRSQIANYFKHSLVTNLVFAGLSLTIILFIIPQLRYFGQDPAILPFAGSYLEITAWSLIPLMILQTLRCYCDGLSNTLYPMLAMIAGNLINIILNYGFIFGKMGLPEMGVAGAALASMIARIMMVGILILLIWKKKRLWQHLAIISFRKLESYLFKIILSLGVPSSLQMFFEVTAFSTAAILMGVLGKNPQAAHQISINLASTTFLICTGIGMAATIRVGNQYGKKNVQKIRNAGFSAICQVVLIMAITAFIFITCRWLFPKLYIDNEEVIRIAALLLIMAGIFQIPDGVQVTALGALRGIQDVKMPTVITFFSYWLVGIPFSYYSVMATEWGPPGVWIGLILGLSLSASLLTWRFHKITRSMRF